MNYNQELRARASRSSIAVMIRHGLMTQRRYQKLLTPFTFKIEPGKGEPAHVVTVSHYRDIFAAHEALANAWQSRGFNAIITHVTN